jgi:hypothetical protein
MEDHTNTSRLTVSACFTRGMRNWLSIPREDRTFQDVYLYHAQPLGNLDPMRTPIIPSLLVDVTEKMDVKAAMLREHKSQKNWLDVSQGKDAYLDAMKRDGSEHVARHERLIRGVRRGLASAPARRACPRRTATRSARCSTGRSSVPGRAAEPAGEGAGPVSLASTATRGAPLQGCCRGGTGGSWPSPAIARPRCSCSGRARTRPRMPPRTAASPAPGSPGSCR